MASSSKSHKRSRAAVDAETDIVIKTAEGEPLPAQSFILRTFSSCARQLPADTAEWDVSGFLYSNRQPFSHDTVACWLSCAASVAYGPAELNADDTKAQLSTATGLHAVLAFAHAVGSPPTVLTAACSQLDSLQIVVQLPEQTLELAVHSQRELVFIDVQLYFADTTKPIGQPLASQQQKKELQRQVAEQLGALLHMAHVLQLQPLIDVLHNFIFTNSRYGPNVLFGVLQLVFADCLEVIGSGTLSKETYIESVLSRPCLFAEGMGGSLLKPVGEIQLAKVGAAARLKFEAEVLHDFGCWQARERVKITLRLFDKDPVMLVQGGERVSVLPAQLLVGRTAANTSSWSDLMSGNLAEP